jgi:hypothetical protein
MGGSFMIPKRRRNHGREEIQKWPFEGFVHSLFVPNSVKFSKLSYDWSPPNPQFGFDWLHGHGKVFCGPDGC